MTSIVNLPLPVQLANGTVADATQVMTDLNYLAAQVNTNAQPIGGSAPTIAGVNYLYNGAMLVDQRNASNVVTVTAGRKYSVDRWQIGRTANSATAQQLSSNSNFPYPYYVRVQRTAADATVTPIQFAQSLESIDSQLLAGQQVALSFWARCGATYSPASSFLNASLYTGTGTDQNVLAGYTGSVQQINNNSVLTTSWQRFTIAAVTLPATSLTFEVGVIFTMTPTGTAGANDYFELSGVQLEVGAAAGPYQFVPFNTELLRCQRYYEKSFGYSQLPTTNGGRPGSFACMSTRNGNVNFQYIQITYKVTKRVPVSFSSYNPAASNNQVRDDTISADCASTTVFYLAENNAVLQFIGNSSTAISDLLLLHWASEADIP